MMPLFKLPLRLTTRTLEAMGTNTMLFVDGLFVWLIETSSFVSHVDGERGFMQEEYYGRVVAVLFF